MKLKISTIVQEIGPDHERASKWKVQNLVQGTRHRRSYIVSNARDGLEDHRAMLTICRYDRRLLNNRGYVDNVRRRLTHKAKMLTTPLNILPEPIDYFHIYNKQDVFSFDQEEQYKKSEPALVTEPYVGQPLDRIIQKQGPLEEYGALSLTLQLCDLVEDLHREHVLFYELRPEDILLDDSDHDRIWLVGGANFQTINKEGQVPIEDLVVPLSDFTYAAPEVEAGRVSLDKRSDYYSLGALLLFMLTGQKPREYLQSKKNYETIYGLDHLSPQTCELLGHCIALNPDDRFASINQIKKALRTARSALGDYLPVPIINLSVTRHRKQHFLCWALPQEHWSAKHGLVIRRWSSDMGQDPPHLDYWKVLINETPSKRKTLDVEAPPADATCCYAVITKAQYKGTQRLSHPAFAILDPTLSWFDSWRKMTKTAGKKLPSWLKKDKRKPRKKPTAG